MHFETQKVCINTFEFAREYGFEAGNGIRATGHQDVINVNSDDDAFASENTWVKRCLLLVSDKFGM